jgi:rhodanese-related sulfurtransferase
LPHVSNDRTVSVERLAELIENNAAQVVDIRADEEWEGGHLAEATHLSFDKLKQGADQLDKSKPVVFYCRGGDRSVAAVDAFRASGWDAYLLEGGLVAWAEAGRPLEPENGSVVERSGLPPR